MNQLSVKQKAGVQLIRAAKRTENQLNPRGRFKIEHWRDGVKINEYDFPNGVTNEGKNKLLDVMFHEVSAITVWYLGLIDLSGYTALAATDTYADINQAGNGWDEFDEYTDPGNGDSGTTRPAWVENPASGQSITNPSPSVFDITGSGTVKGVFLAGGAAGAQNKNDYESASTLWATALFTSGDVTVANGDQLKVTYTVSA